MGANCVFRYIGNVTHKLVCTFCLGMCVPENASQESLAYYSPCAPGISVCILEITTSSLESQRGSVCVFFVHVGLLNVEFCIRVRLRC